MKRLRDFTYHEPASVAEAVEILAGTDDARLLAGGTDLVVDMKTARMRPATVVNLKRIPGLDAIEAVPGGTRIGALTTASVLARSTLVRDRHPALAQAAEVLATPPVRGLATIGGNIGRASPASDLAPPLIVHRATATIEGVAGSREEPVEDLYAGPGVTTLARHDVVTAVFLAESPPRSASVHLKVGSRAGGTDIAMVAVSALVVLGDGCRIDDARIVLASVAPTPIRAAQAEDLLRGAAPTAELVARAADAAAGDCRPISDTRTTAAHRLALARVLTRRALEAALTAAGTGEGR